MTDPNQSKTEPRALTEGELIGLTAGLGAELHKTTIETAVATAKSGQMHGLTSLLSVVSADRIFGQLIARIDDTSTRLTRSIDAFTKASDRGAVRLTRAPWGLVVVTGMLALATIAPVIVEAWRR